MMFLVPMSAVLCNDIAVRDLYTCVLSQMSVM